jgi:hypothetical protein
MGIISQSQLASELGVMPYAMLRYVREGLPVRAGGVVDRTEALEWLARKYATPASDMMWNVGARVAKLLGG